MKFLKQIKRVKRKVILWLNHPEQINAKILNLFMELSENGNKGVFCDMLEDEFDIRFPEIRDSFMRNYVQMKNEAEHNHCKVFDEDKENTVVLWCPVREFIIERYTEKQLKEGQTR